MHSGGGVGYSATSFEDEPPLLEELGINFEHIQSKALAALNPIKPMPANLMEDTDLAGPLLFCLLFAAFLLMTGKVHFGYIYGMAMVGCVSMYTILNLMSEAGLSLTTATSVLGYCLLPLVLLSVCGTLLSLKGTAGLILSTASIGWCTFSAAKMFVTVLNMKDQRLLVAYPTALLYTCFALLTVF